MAQPIQRPSKRRMTLSPVFRSQEAVRLLAEEGVWAGLAPDMAAQAEAVRVVYGDLEGVVGPQFRMDPPHVPFADEVSTPAGLQFLQEYFFLILFRSIFRALDVPAERLRLYTELNFCIKGTITAADNLFDDQEKSLLPLRPHAGPRFMSILQLMAFERLQRNALDRAESAGVLDRSEAIEVQRALLDRMASIGTLEGSEEGGVEGIPEPETMVDDVHRVRGGALFALAFAAPGVIEGAQVAERLERAEAAVAQLGTAFQIVDDLTDFEFDVGRRSHNLLTSQVHHRGRPDERLALQQAIASGQVAAGAVESTFRESARAVLERAYAEARSSFATLHGMGHWFPPSLADEVVHAIVGLEGVARMASITEGA